MTLQNYHKHDYYTNPIIPDSIVSPEDYAKRAVELGHGILASTNHGWAGRYIEHYELAKKYGLKFLFGIESYFVKDRKEKDQTNAHIILLARNENGRKGINRIISEANLTGFYYRARVDFELLESLPAKDVWITTACLGGVWKYEDYRDIIERFHSFFGNSLYLEVQSHNVDCQKNINKTIIDISNGENIPLIYGCDSHYIFPEQAELREELLLSKKMHYSDEDNWFMDYPDRKTCEKRLLDQGVLNSHQIKEALDNTNNLLEVEEYRSEVFQSNVKLPTIYPEKTQEEKNEKLKEIVYSAWEKEKQKVPKEKHGLYEKEIEKELAVVFETGMADYFLLDAKVIYEGKKLGGHITLTGRGSAPSFYLCKLLGLTTIDRISAPIKLFPERFMTAQRIIESKSLPDIDFNLSDPTIFATAQEHVLGDNHSYPLMAFGTLRPKAAWKMLARAKDIDFDIANDVSNQIDKMELKMKHLDEGEEILPENFIDKDHLELYEQSKVFLSVISDYKIHPCAYLLYDKDIREEIGIIRIKDHICACMDGLWAEKYGFVKNDLLKVSVVDLIYRVYERINVKPHTLPELIEVCKDDESVWKVYKNGWTVGVNQVEGRSTTGRVAKYAPRNIAEVSAFVAAIRPGFQSNYKQFEARQHFEYGVPSLDKLIQTEDFKESYMLYQENAMQVLAYAGIPVHETYDVVKNIAKKRTDKVLSYKQIFIHGIKSKIVRDGYSEKESEEIANNTWKVIEDSSNYSFNCSHSYSMAGDSLYCAYLKSHYPHEYYETLIKIAEESGDKDRIVVARKEAEEAYKINFPSFRFGQDNREIVGNKENNRITFSLSSIKGMGKKISNQMFDLSKVEHETFLDMLIYAEENGYITSKMQDLIKIGYFNQFGANKKLLIFFSAFTESNMQYKKSYVEKTKQERKTTLQEFWKTIPEEILPISVQLEEEMKILGHVVVTYPIEKKFVLVTEIDARFSPRLQVYCINNGTQASIKIKKSLFAQKPFSVGKILYIETFKKSPAWSHIDGKFVEKEDEFDWWAENYSLVSNEDFDKMIAKKGMAQ